MKKIIYVIILCFISACGGGGGGGSSCGGLSGDICPLGQFCKFDDLSCGAADTTGICEEIPTSCPATVSSVCTCDLLTFDNECLANKSGQSVVSLGECA